MKKRLLENLIFILFFGIFSGLLKQNARGERKLGPYPSDSIFKAKKYYKRGNYTKSSEEFYKILTAVAGEKKSSINRKAEWGLAQSLSKMNLYYSASMYLSRIVRRGPGRKNPFFRRSFEALGRINNKVNLGQSHIVQLFRIKINPASIPGPARGFYFYYKGVESFGRKRYKSAHGFFKRVQSSSQYYIKALFHMGVIASISGKPQKGLKFFEKVRDLSSDVTNGSWLREQTALNIARIHYEKKDFREAIRYYAQIPRQSDNWLQALFEASWAFFLMEKANNTLGTIHTLHSPFFKNRFFPESYILQAITFLRMCRYDRVKESMALFKKRYSPVLKDIKTLLAESKNNPKKFFRYVYDYRIGSLVDFKHAWVVLDALARTDTYKQAGATIEIADDELARLGDSPVSWRVIGLLGELKKFLKKKKIAAINDTGKRLYRQGNSFYKYLVELASQTSLITAELLLGKVDNLRSKMNIDTAPRQGNFIGGMQPLKLNQDLEYWPFEGEYWEDELGGYVYNISSKCGSKGSKS